MVFALIGNQNCGKTTLFNQLTGSNQRVGNFPGVTVDRKEGIIKKHSDLKVVDLPGIYSLSPYTTEEIVTRDFLINSKPDAIINIIDATNIERNLYLTLQTLSLEIPTVIALNMMDEVRASGNSIDTKKLSELLGVEVVPISAAKNEGVSHLVDTLVDVASKKIKPKNTDFCSGAAHRAIHSVCHIIEDHALEANIPRRFASSKIIEGDLIIFNKLNLSPQDVHAIEHIITEMEDLMGMDREAALADTRYAFIETVCKVAVKKNNESKQQERSVKLDNILTHKYLALPIFLAIMGLIFWLTFDVIGSFLSDVLAYFIDIVTTWTSQALINLDINPVVRSLVIDGVFQGVGSVLSFLPIIVVLFYFLSLLEDSGYIARVAFFMDKLLRKIGLSGKSFVPMLIGFGCSVPAIMASRTLASKRDRVMTILLIPFMSCSAKLPIYSVFATAFFPKHSALVMIGLYLFGIVLGILTGLIFKNTLFKGNPVPFVLELPAYRFPSFKTTMLLMWEKTKDFIVKAFTIIFVATVLIWFLQTFDLRFNIAENQEASMLCSIGRFIAPIFTPLGFGNWRAASALISGFSAKEAVVSTLAVISGNEPLTNFFTPLSALSYLVFTLLYTPCAAAIATVKKELNGFKSAVGVMIFQTTTAWIVAFLVYNIGLLLTKGLI